MFIVFSSKICHSGAPCFDIVNQRYFVVVSNDSNYILSANLVNKQLDYVGGFGSNTPDHLQFDIKNNRLLLSLNHTLMAIDNVKTGKLTTIAPLPAGITGLFATTIDNSKGMYYAHLTLPLTKGTEYRLAWVNVNSKQTGYSIIYDDLTNLHFIPAK